MPMVSNYGSPAVSYVAPADNSSSRNVTDLLFGPSAKTKVTKRTTLLIFCSKCTTCLSFSTLSQMCNISFSTLSQQHNISFFFYTVPNVQHFYLSQHCPKCTKFLFFQHCPKCTTFLSFSTLSQMYKISFFFLHCPNSTYNISFFFYTVPIVQHCFLFLNCPKCTTFLFF